MLKSDKISPPQKVFSRGFPQTSRASDETTFSRDILALKKKYRKINIVKVVYPVMKQTLSLSERFCALLESKPTENLKNILCELSSDYGFDHLTYYSSAVPTPSGDQAVLMTTYSKNWVTHYFEQGYEKIDPVLFAGSRSLLPVDWTGLATADESAKRFFGEAEEFGVRKCGLTVPVRGLYGEQAMVSLNSGCAEGEWNATCQALASDFLYLAHLIHEKVVASHCQDFKRPMLSRREAEVLRWAARGKTAWETATVLGLKEKTVSFYIGNACTKLGVATKTQAVAKVLRERLILY